MIEHRNGQVEAAVEKDQRLVHQKMPFPSWIDETADLAAAVTGLIDRVRCRIQVPKSNLDPLVENFAVDPTVPATDDAEGRDDQHEYHQLVARFRSVSLVRTL